MSNYRPDIRITTHPVAVAEDIASHEAFIVERDARDADLWAQARANNAMRSARERNRWSDTR